MTKFLTRWPAKAVTETDDLDDNADIWPAQPSLIEQRDGAIAAHMHAEQERNQAVRQRDRIARERDLYAAVLRLICAGAAATTAETAGTPIGDQLAAEVHCELCGNWMPAAELDGHMDRHDTEGVAPKAVSS